LREDADADRLATAGFFRTHGHPDFAAADHRGLLHGENATVQEALLPVVFQANELLARSRQRAGESAEFA
jgi:hypothetical protein